jgi:hypothetical protein
MSVNREPAPGGPWPGWRQCRRRFLCQLRSYSFELEGTSPQVANWGYQGRVNCSDRAPTRPSLRGYWPSRTSLRAPLRSWGCRKQPCRTAEPCASYADALLGFPEAIAGRLHPPACVQLPLIFCARAASRWASKLEIHRVSPSTPQSKKYIRFELLRARAQWV